MWRFHGGGFARSGRLVSTSHVINRASKQKAKTNHSGIDGSKGAPSFSV